MIWVNAWTPQCLSTFQHFVLVLVLVEHPISLTNAAGRRKLFFGQTCPACKVDTAAGLKSQECRVFLDVYVLCWENRELGKKTTSKNDTILS